MGEKKSDPSISVIMPVYNEPELVVTAVARIDGFLCQHFENYEILIVESGSTDQTGKQCDRLAEQYRRVRTIHEGSRNGFGSALRLGYRSSQYEYCWLITADIPFPLETILDAVKLLNQYDFVISYRSEDTRAWTRRIQSFFYNCLVRLWFHLPVTCVNSAFKLLPREVMAQMPLVSNFWFIDAEIIYRLIHAGYTFTEIPVPLIDREQGTSSVGAGAFVKMLAEMRDFAKISKEIPDARGKNPIEGGKK